MNSRFQLLYDFMSEETTYKDVVEDDDMQMPDYADVKAFFLDTW